MANGVRHCRRSWSPGIRHDGLRGLGARSASIVRRNARGRRLAALTARRDSPLASDRPRRAHGRSRRDRRRPRAGRGRTRISAAAEAWAACCSCAIRPSGEPALVALALRHDGGTRARDGAHRGAAAPPHAAPRVVVPGDAHAGDRRSATRFEPSRACLQAVRSEERAAGRAAPGMFDVPAGRVLPAPLLLLLPAVSAGTGTPTSRTPSLLRMLDAPGEQRPVLLPLRRFAAVREAYGARGASQPLVQLGDVVLLLPGPYARCGI